MAPRSRAVRHELEPPISPALVVVAPAPGHDGTVDVKGALELKRPRVLIRQSLRATGPTGSRLSIAFASNQEGAPWSESRTSAFTDNELAHRQRREYLGVL